MVNEHESTNFITRLNKLDENKTKRSLTIQSRLICVTSIFNASLPLCRPHHDMIILKDGRMRKYSWTGRL